MPRRAAATPDQQPTVPRRRRAARDSGIIGPAEARRRIAATLAAVAGLERHRPSGMFYNWYDPATGAKLTTWPVDGNPVDPFLSSVDNGWMAAALQMVANAVPQLRSEARALLEPMDFGHYLDPAANLLRGGFWVDPPAPGTCTAPGNYRYRGMRIVPAGAGACSRP
jgi:hypothetical protein